MDRDGLDSSRAISKGSYHPMADTEYRQMIKTYKTAHRGIGPLMCAKLLARVEEFALKFLDMGPAIKVVAGSITCRRGAQL